MKTSHLRLVPALLLGALMALPSNAQPAPAAPNVAFAPKASPTTSLKDTYKGIFHVGVALNPGQFTGSNVQGAALVKREFDCISPENVLKWDGVESQNNQFDFRAADQYVEFGLANKMFIVGHNLCWHSQLPGWVSQPDPGQAELTKEVLMARLKNHIMTVAGRYKGKINGWDVVNEAINDGQGGYRNSIFYQVIGQEFLPLAFKWAHEAAPDAELYYNDYNLDANDAKRATCLELIKYLKEQGAPITGIGMQGHYNLGTPSAAKIDETIGMFAALGMKVMITELDVQVRGGAVSGAVGATFAPAANGGAPAAAAAGARRGGQGGGARGAGGFVPPATPLPPLETLKTGLTLTDAQITAIAPILEADGKALQTITTSQANLAKVRADSITAINKVLNSGQQQTQFNLVVTPPAGGGARVGGAPAALTDDQQQALAKRYGEIFAVLLKHRDAVTRVTFWGLRDADSWRRTDSPLIFDDNYNRKPAYDAVINAVKLASLAK